MACVLIADDHPLFRQALAMAVRLRQPDAKLLEAGDVDTAIALAEQAGEALSLILLDLHMPGAVGYSGVALLHAAAPHVPILVVSAADPSTAAREAQRFGAVGFIGKDSALEEIEATVGEALAGQLLPLPPPDGETDQAAQQLASLTPMQIKVLTRVLGGLLNKQIAYELGISEATVKAHMTAILRKLDVNNRTQAALAARALGLELSGV